MLTVGLPETTLKVAMEQTWQQCNTVFVYTDIYWCKVWISLKKPE